MQPDRASLPGAGLCQLGAAVILFGRLVSRAPWSSRRPRGLGRANVDADGDSAHDGRRDGAALLRGVADASLGHDSAASCRAGEARLSDTTRAVVTAGPGRQQPASPSVTQFLDPQAATAHPLLTCARHLLRVHDGRVEVHDLPPREHAPALGRTSDSSRSSGLIRPNAAKHQLGCMNHPRSWRRQGARPSPVPEKVRPALLGATSMKRRQFRCRDDQWIAAMRHLSGVRSSTMSSAPEESTARPRKVPCAVEVEAAHAASPTTRT